MRPSPIALSCALALVACTPAPRPDARPTAADATPDATTPPAPPPPPAPAVVPRGCELNLRGRYRLAGRVPLTYLVEDDGTHLLLRLEGVDAGAEALALTRTAKGFVGVVTGQAKAPGGTLCAVSFRAELVACRADALVLRSEDAVKVDDACQLREPAPATEKTLLRE